MHIHLPILSPSRVSGGYRGILVREAMASHIAAMLTTYCQYHAKSKSKTLQPGASACMRREADRQTAMTLVVFVTTRKPEQTFPGPSSKPQARVPLSTYTSILCSTLDLQPPRFPRDWNGLAVLLPLRHTLPSLFVLCNCGL